jgi:hypothetical protein
MAITAAVCNSWKSEIVGGTHAAADVYKIALYTSTATLDATTTAYSATNEVSGTGYTAAGTTLSGFSVTGTTTARLDFTAPSWPSSTITARGALIYNSSKSNKAVAVLNFGSDITSTNGTFTVNMPAVGDSTSLIRIA